jgi:hypothetical protein
MREAWVTHGDPSFREYSSCGDHPMPVCGPQESRHIDQGRIVQGTHRPRDVWSQKKSMKMVHTRTHRHDIPEGTPKMSVPFYGAMLVRLRTMCPQLKILGCCIPCTSVGDTTTLHSFYGIKRIARSLSQKQRPKLQRWATKF